MVDARKYSMEDKYLYPLLGIVLGWFLKELSTAFQASQDSKRKLGKALSALAYLNREMTPLKVQFEAFKDLSSSHKEFEAFRQYILKRYPRRDDVFIKSLHDSISTVAELLPLSALNLDQLVNRYEFLQDVKLTNTSQDYELYVYQLSSLEVGFELYQKDLEKIIRKLAFMHGIKTWLQFVYEMHQFKKNNPRESKYYNKLIEQFQEAKEKSINLNEAPNKANSADAEKSA